MFRGQIFMVTMCTVIPRLARTRDGKRLLLFLSTLFVLLGILHPSIASITTESLTGKAVNKAGELQYIELHTVTYEKGRVIRSLTTYIDSRNNVIGELVSEYLPNPQFNNYTFKDIRARYEDGVKVSGEQLFLYRKESPEKDAESAQLSKQANQIVGQGFHHFLKLNLEDIAGGKVFHIQLVMPSRLNQYSFRIRKQKLQGQILHVRLEGENWFMRLFAPHVDCEYDLGTRRLMRYVGISNLENASGLHKQVDISYTYGD